MKNIMIIAIASMTLFVTGCTSGGSKDLAPPSQQTNTGQLPGWFLEMPVEDGVLYATATEVSQDMQMAFDKAELKALKNMSGRMESKMKAVTSRVQEEVGFGDDSEMTDSFRNTMEQLVNKTLKGTRVVKKKPVREGSLWRAYMLISYDSADAAEQVMNEMRNAEMYKARKEHKSELEDMRRILDEEFND